MENKIEELKEKKKKIIEKNNLILNKIREKNKIHFNAKIYNKYKNNTAIAIGIISFIGLQFIFSKTLELSMIRTMLLSAAPSIALSTGIQVHFEKQKKKMQNECPQIDLEKYDIDEEARKINEMFEKSFILTDELGIINNELNQMKTEEKPKVKVMTYTRKK